MPVKLSSQTIWNACRQQAAAYNRAVEDLIDRPEEPLRRSPRRGRVGLQGRWLNWRAEDEGLAQAFWRGGVSQAHSKLEA